MTASKANHHPLLDSLLRAQERYHFFETRHPEAQDISSQTVAGQTSSGKGTFFERVDGLTLPGRALPVVVAVSGGADSVCLLHLLLTLRDTWRLDLHVAHFDHAVRANSSEDAQFVEGMANKLHLPFHLGNPPFGNATETNYQTVLNEATLRTLRYKFLFQVARSVTPANQMPIIAVAHHADDQAETILLRMVRGAGMQGLGGMQPVSQHYSSEHKEYVRVIRPLLDVRRSEIIRYLHDMGVGWREDPTNLSLDYARNRIRHNVLPELQAINQQAVETIVRSARLLAESAARLERLNRTLLNSLLLNLTINERVLLDLRKFAMLDEADQRAILHLALQELTQDRDDSSEVSYEQIETLRQQLQTQEGATQTRSITAELVWSIIGAKEDRPLLLSLHRSSVPPKLVEHPQLPNDFIAVPLEINTTLQIGEWSLQVSLIAINDLPADWRTSTHGWQAWFDADKVNRMVLTVSHPGMRIAPLGMQGKSKSLGDFFTDRKIHPSERADWPLIVDQERGELVWVCGLATAHFAQISDETRRVLGMRWL